MPLIGTAGHVDHGKSTLVAALTGRDPDRWAEEKSRGLTIDLGFAWTQLGDLDVSFVDVPGHERFLKNMLAGVDPVDVALFVVAADEGWAPQSEEHLAVLDLLGIASGVVALTKTDRVDADLVELAALEIEERLDGSSLSGSPIVGVSAARGTGLDELRSALVSALSSAPPRTGGPPALWVDRAFAVAGAGTVVTGSLSGGPISLGDSLTLHPAGLTSRVRSIQSHEVDRETVEPGRRVAIGLPDIPREAATRGTVLAPRGHRWQSRVLLAAVRPARGFTHDHLERGAFHLHLGTGDWPVTVRPVEQGVAVIRSQDPIPAIVGELFILRDAGRRAVVGGGTVLDPDPDPRSARATRASKALLPAASNRNAAASVLVALRGAIHVNDLAALTGGGVAEAVPVIGTMAMDPDHLARLVSIAEMTVLDHHREYPLRDGLPKAELASRLGVDGAAVDVIVDHSPLLTGEGAAVSHQAHRPHLTAGQEAAWLTIESTLAAAALAPPRASEAIADPELRHLLLRMGRVVRVGEFLYLPTALASIRGRLEPLDQPFSAAQAKDALGISRKHAIPLLEWCDANGITRRTGSDRVLR